MFLRQQRLNSSGMASKHASKKVVMACRLRNTEGIRQSANVGSVLERDKFDGMVEVVAEFLHQA
ncbi:hypothetical protein PC114_g26722 [Phytophthora cactorum]|uniref:Uncharacterized protein n=1 Tax=Phytophthora cactorum TaxID=29920 RepID=A0A8T1AS04_9STRA|nr:hypothetical protein PC114_g26722 [Phytophthora cactorum]KAG2885756.1 hypothetical protein PC117_g25524 [Phytophthora cactorum]KAG3123494.1 hypothetical protein C6341_g26537 [Phytophthora cactorum]